jgi:TfoX/Sxy family transcriptional regulator of competence genes
VAYDEKLAERVRKAMATRKRVTEKKMFGGLAFLLGGRMCCGILNDDLMVRVGPERYAAALARPHVRPMDFTGKPLSGFVYVGSPGVKTGAALVKWLRDAAEYAASLPAGKAAPRKRTSGRAGAPKETRRRRIPG